MVNGRFFCGTLTSRVRGRTPFVQAGAETSDAGAEVVKSDSHCSCRGHSGRVGANVGDKSTES